MTDTIHIRLGTELRKQIDLLIEKGEFSSESDIVKKAIFEFMKNE